MLTLAGGTLAGQLILFVSLPFLQRYFYGPEAFGMLTVYVSVSELLSDVSGLKYEYGIVRMHRHKDAVNLMMLSLASMVTVAALSTAAFALLYFFYPAMAMVQDLGIYLFLVPLSVLFFGAFNTLTYWFNRQEGYRVMAAGKLVNSSVSEPAKFGWGRWIGQTGAGLILGRIAGQFAGTACALGAFLRSDKRLLRLVSPARIRQLVKEQKHYPLFVTPSTLITASVTVIYVQFFSSHFGQEKVGLLGVSVSYIGVAFGIMSNAFGQVFYKRISTVKDGHTLKKMYLRFAGLLALPALAALAAVWIIPESAVTYVLGDRWAGTMPIARVMVPWMGIAFISSSLSFMHIRLGTQNRLLVIDLLHLAGVVAALWGGYRFFGTFSGILYCFAAAQALHYILVILAAVYFLNQKITSDHAPLQE